MAEIINSKKQGKRKTQDPRIDLTPMVDLGFLLITFFMYTTTMAKSKSLELTMPDPTPVDKPVAYVKESTITLIPVKGHKIIYYPGTLEDQKQLTLSSLLNNEIKNVLIQKAGDAKALPSSFNKEAHQLHIIIRPADDCSYQDIVTLLDDMKTLDVQYYAIADLSDYEKEMIAKKFGTSYGK
jgi:biopolymer transport protein ExbD